MVKRVSIVLATLVLMIAGFITPAYAATTCASGYVCAWDDSQATVKLFQKFQSPGTCYNVDPEDNDKANMFQNRLAYGFHVQFYRDANCTGQLLRNILGSTGPFASRDVAEYFYWTSLCTCDRNRLTSVWFNNG